jgi:hypothetical protein
VGSDERGLIDVLKRPAAAQGGRGRTAQHHDGRLRELGVLQRGDHVGQAGAGRHGSDPWCAGQASHRIGREHRRRLVPHVDDSDPLVLAPDQDRRNVTAAQGKQETYAVFLQDRRDSITTVHRADDDTCYGKLSG